MNAQDREGREKICPECGFERIRADGRCERCGAATDGPSGDEEMVPILRTTDPAFLPIAQSVLDAAGIPWLLQGGAGIELFPLGAAGTRVSGRATGAILLVPRSREEEARALLESPGPEER